ncbi:MAG TPA: mechanosensitive ion channel family protein [Rickettsiales bacterium]|nr:mechanosensitive ion channel family protein [Rickettsiales bacterium]
MNILTTYFNFFDNLNVYLKISIQIFSIILLTFFLSKLIKSLLFVLFKYFMRTNSLIDNSIIVALKKPIFFFIWLYSVIICSDLIIEQLNEDLLKFTYKLRYVIIYIIVFMFFMSIISQIKKHYIMQKEKMNKALDYAGLDTVEKLSKVAIFIIWTILVLGKMGFNLNALLAFGGAGGVIIGFAGKDLFTNIFGGLIIYLDKPFSVGDWISSPDKQIEGDVEVIGWRQTRILTFDKYPIYVPNSIFGTIIIENKSRYRAMRVREEIKIRMFDLSKVSRITNAITKMLKEHPSVNKKYRMYVNFINFSESSLSLIINVFTNTTEYIRFLEIKQDVLLKIANIIKENGAEIALPTSNVYMNKVSDFEKKILNFE